MQHLGVAVAGDDPAHRERWPSATSSSDSCDGPSLASRSASLDRSCVGVAHELVLGDDAAVRLGLDRRDAREARLLTLLAQLLLAGEGEDAVGLLGELDRAETREDRHEVDRRDQRVHVAAAEERPRRDPVEDGGAAGEGEPGQERAPGSADAERHREREPDEPGKHRRGGVGERERVHAEQRATDPGDRGDRANIMIFDRFTLMPDASAATSELRTASAARPDDECFTAWMTSVSRPNTTRNSRICSCSIVKSSFGRCATSPVHSSLCTRKSFTQLTPGMSSDGARIDQPLWPLRTSSIVKGTSARKNAHARVPSAKLTPPSLVSGSASSAPSAAAARRGDHHRPEEVELPVRGDARDVDAEVVGERPAPREPARGHEARLHEAHLAAHAGDDDEREEDDPHHQALRDDGLVVGVGAQPVPPEPAERERDEDQRPDRPRQPAAQLRQPVAMVGWRDVVGHRTRASRPVAADEQQQHDDEQVRHGRPEAAEIAQELGQDVVAVARDQVLDDPQQQAAGERDRDRSQPTEDDRGERAEDDEGEHEVLELEERRDEHSAQAGEDHRENPRDRRRARRVHAADARQRVAVDDGAHLETDACPPDHEPEDDRGERGDDEHRDLVGVQDDPADLVGVVGRLVDAGDVQALVDRVVALEPEAEHVVADRDDEPLDQRGEGDEQADGADDARVHRRRREAPQQDAVEQEAQQRREDEHRDARARARSGPPSPVLSW